MEGRGDRRKGGEGEGEERERRRERGKGGRGGREGEGGGRERGKGEGGGRKGQGHLIWIPHSIPYSIAIRALVVSMVCISFCNLLKYITLLSLVAAIRKTETGKLIYVSVMKRMISVANWENQKM